MARPFRLLPDDPEMGRLPYLWLFYLGFVFVGPLLGGQATEPVIWIASLVSLVLFLPVYFWGHWVDGRRRALAGVVVCLIGTGLSPWSAGANTYFIYGAYFGGYAATQARELPKTLGPAWLALLLTAVFVQPSPYFWIPATAGAIVIGLVSYEQRRRAQHNHDLRMARAEVEALARIAERERIARDLHDLLGQSLSVVSLKAELAGRLLEGDPARAGRELADIQQVARQSLSEVRTAVTGYRRGSGAGLRMELDNARRALEAAGVELSCDDELEPLAQRLDAEHEAVVALALREGVTNVMRHAGATACRVGFIVDPKRFGVEIADNGRGSADRLGNGLTGMRERVESLGGRFELEAGRGSAKGTTIRLLFEPEPSQPPPLEAA